MFKRLSLITAICAIFFSTFGISSALAQTQSDDLKIGYVNPQAILSRMPEMKAVQQRLQNFIDRKSQEFQQKQANFQQQVADFEQRQEVISAEAKQKEEERLGQLQAELQRTQSEFQQQIQQKQQELVGPLMQQISQAIDTVASDMGLTYVLNTTTSQGDEIILYVSEDAQNKYDITDQVMRQLGI
ncbi:MAG: OmpH family outer membrane protein [Balneolaceae bacterium]|nr:OmpH family outer membrane protein [Balneolaceae bacterium]